MSSRAHPASPRLFDDADQADPNYFDAPFGLFARQKIQAMARRRLVIAARPFEDAQFQPASLDLRLGKEAFRVRASFLPGAGHSVEQRLASLNPERISLTGEGAVLEKGRSGSSFFPACRAPLIRKARPDGSTSSPG
jgi:dCTP deaminase